MPFVSAMSVILLPRDDQVAGAVHHTGPAWLDQGRRVGLLDDRGACERKTLGQGVAIVDGGAHEPGLACHHDLALADFLRAVGGGKPHLVEDLAAAGAMDRAHAHDLGRNLDAVAVDAVVGFEEVAIEAARRVGVVGVQRDLEVVRLADVADVGEVADGDLVGVGLLGGPSARPPAGRSRLKLFAQGGEIECGDRRGELGRDLVLDRRRQQARRRQHAGQARHDDAADAELARQGRGMDAAGAAQGTRA